MKDDIRRIAHISDDRLYRYWLGREWSTGYLLPFVMLNPSTADAQVDDPTIQRCMGFARREKAAGMTVYNLYAFRATDPKMLRSAINPVGSDNENILRALVEGAARDDHPIVCAWGQHPMAHLHGFNFCQMARKHGARLKCLGMTNRGYPRHPLYVRGDQQLIDYAPWGTL